MDPYSGKATKEIIDWWFDEGYQEERQEMHKFNISKEEVAQDYECMIANSPLPINIAEERIKNTQTAKKYRAMYIDVKNIQAWDIFGFIRDNDNLTSEKSGMQSITTGLDMSKLKNISKDYKLDFSAIKDFIKYYESKMLKAQRALLERK